MVTAAPPEDYARPFWIEGPVGNNAFAYAHRGIRPRLWVPSLIDGTMADIRIGDEIVFADVDEHGTLRSCLGLAHFIRTTWDDVPMFVTDNHNHAFYFWFEAAIEGRLQHGATLIHLDQHRDTRVPERPFDAASTLGAAFHYTNFHLNVGNYIVPAKRAGLVDDMLLVTGETGLNDRSMTGRRNSILNIDLDFFAPEMASIDFDLTRRFINAHRSTASLITVATSPFFIDQPRAIAFLQKLLET